ncbi:MAG: penicillin-binding protein [Sphingobacteriales bacterium]|nr:penicillin-binding protein [Sphingobacteriales bacterium]
MNRIYQYLTALFPNNAPTPQAAARYRRFKRYFWGLLGYGIIGIFLFFLAIRLGLLGALPSFRELENPDSSLATQVYTMDGKELGKFYIQDRTNVRYEDLPVHLVNALIATEDERFYQHSGIDGKALARAVFRFGKDGGGSTITQQLALNLFHSRASNKLMRIIQKFKEWIIALQLERNYTKEEIIMMYLNTVPFSYNVHGIKSAAKTYFNTTPQELTIPQAAVLVGMLKGNTLYNPVRNPENATKRRNVVIDQMHKAGLLGNFDLDSLKREPLIVKFTSSAHDEGSGTYFREHLRAWLKDWAAKRAKIDGSDPLDVHKDGLKIYTTIDSRMQAYAEEAVKIHMADLQKDFDEHWKDKDPWFDDEPSKVYKGETELIERAIKNSNRYQELKNLKMSETDIWKNFNTPIPMTVFEYKYEKEKNEKGKMVDKFIDTGGKDTTMSPLDSIKYYKRLLNTGFLAMEPQTGYVKVWIGGVDYKYFKYDNARESSKKQVGSTFKPFVYTVAIQNGWSPCQYVANVPVTFNKKDCNLDLPEPWTPKNADNSLNGQSLTLKKGLAKSVNYITAYLMKEVCPQAVVDLAHKMGIVSHLDPYPSIALGTADISLIEMIGAYGTFANKGTWIEPIFVTRIEDKNGIVLEDFTPKMKEVLSEQDAYVMIQMLRGVVDIGTAIRLRGKYAFRAEIAGKTGTTNDHSDGWFMGVVPKLVAGAWTGGDEKRIHFRELSLGAGSNMALPIWGEFMQRVYADTTLGITEDDVFEQPKYLGIELNCGAYEMYDPTSPFRSAPTETTNEYNDRTPDAEEDFF